MDDAKCYYPKGEEDVFQASSITPGQFEKIATAKGHGTCDKFFTPMYGDPSTKSVGCFKRQKVNQVYYTGASQELCVGANGMGMPNEPGQCFDLSTLIPNQIYAGFAWKVTGRYRFEEDMLDKKYKWCLEAHDTGYLIVDGKQMINVKSSGSQCTVDWLPKKNENEQDVSIEVDGLYTTKGGRMWINLWIRFEGDKDVPLKYGFQSEA